MAGILPTIADVSVWQGDIDWTQAKPNLHFAILRVQDGTVLDRKLQRNVSECQRLGIPYYCYGFYRGGGAQEAARMVARAKAAGVSTCLGYVLDVEVAGLGAIREAMAELKRAGGGKAGLYVANHLYGTYGTGYGEDFVWIPRYGTNDGTAQTPPAHPCDLWQFTSKGSVPGIAGSVDLNACVNKDLAWFLGTSVPAPSAGVEAVDRAVYRLYNPGTGEHLFTPTHAEASQLAASGWAYEGVGWTYGDGEEVMRLWNPATGEHLLTTAHAEHDQLLVQGWACEGVSFGSGDGLPVYRLCSPAARHMYTTSDTERDQLVAAGWRDEGVAFHAAK